MPIVTIRMIKDRTDEQKRALVTEAVPKTANIPKKNIPSTIE